MFYSLHYEDNKIATIIQTTLGEFDLDQFKSAFKPAKVPIENDIVQKLQSSLDISEIIIPVLSFNFDGSKDMKVRNNVCYT